MSQSFAQQYLALVHPQPGRMFVAMSHPAKGWQQEPVETPEAALQSIDQFEAQAPTGVFLSQASFVPTDSSRSAQAAQALSVFFSDFDIGQQPGKYPSKEAALAAIRTLENRFLPCTAIVDTGGGYHAYWGLEQPLPTAQWLRLAQQLKQALAHAGVLSDKTVTADPARVLRVPGTSNRKQPVPRPCVFLEHHSQRRYSSEAVHAALGRFDPTIPDRAPSVIAGTPPKAAASTRSLLQLAMPFPPSPSIDAVEKACPAIRALAQTGGLTEEAWALGILHTAIHTDNPSAAAHAWSRSYPGYQPDQVDHKLSEQHKASKPPTGCERIFTLEASCATACNSCTYRGKVSSPIHAAQKWTAYTQATFPQQVLPVAVTASPSHVEPDYGYTDTGNAQRLHRSLGDRIAWVHELHTWLCFSDGAWNDVSEAQMIALATPVMRQLYGEAAASPSAPEAKALATHATKSLNNSALNNTVALLKSRPGVEIHATQLNANDMQLGTADGHVIDLTTGTSRPQIPADFITKALGCQFDPAATCPTWLAFLASIFQEGQGATQDADDGGRIVYLQQWVGYALTGQTKEQQFQFAYGLGANGKTVLYRILQALLGSYCLQSQPEAFMLKQSGEGATPLLARLQGARLVIAAETEDGQRLAESTVKQLTGGDTIVARPLYGQPFEFNPKFKLVIVGNHKPLIRGDDHGIWRRVHLLPFNRIFEAHQQDRDLYAKLHRELPGILNWAIEGCLLWQKAGRLTVPNLMQKEVQEYRSEMDLIQQWLLDDCDVAPGLTVPGQSAYACFSGWCKQNGNGSFSNRRFSQKLIERGFKKTRTKSARGWDGFTCRQSMFASLL